MRLALFGATGSIGRNTLKLLEESPQAREACNLVALSGHNNLALLAEQARAWQPEQLLITQVFDAEKQALFHGYRGEILWGEAQLADYASSASCDNLLLAISGSAALPAAWAAANSGKRLLLANKEALVAAGELIVNAARASGAELAPVDSEHNALWQCLGMPRLPGKLPERVERLEITASGGPFWDWPADRMRHATLDEACRHPNWRMGAKISVDSATMVNKALELIEARWLFDTERLSVLVHPQSLVHGLIHMESGSTLAQLSQPDMRVALASALFGKKAPASGVKPLSLLDCSQLTFFPPDNQRFAAIPLVREAMRAGADRCLCFDISNEVANLAFREGRIPFGAIVETITEIMHTSQAMPLESIETVRHRQRELAAQTRKLIASQESKSIFT